MPRYDFRVFGEIKELINAREYAERYLEKRGKDNYVCPCCGSGNGPHHTAAMNISASGEKWHCYSCNADGDVFDLAKAVLGIESTQEALEEVARLVGYDLTESRSGQDNGYKERIPKKPTEQPVPKDHLLDPAELKENQNAEARKLRFLRKLIDKPEAVAYLEQRGIPLSKAKEWGLGYNEKTHRLVIPWKGCNYYHIDRDVTDKQKARYLKPKYELLGAEPLYNAAALRETAVVFVVEGPLDALAVSDLGFEAVALGTSGSAQAAVDIAAEKPTAAIVLLLDNDADRDDGRNPGLEGRNEMVGKFKELGISGSVCNALVRLGVKDPFEAWQTCPDKLKMELGKIVEAFEVRANEQVLQPTLKPRRADISVPKEKATPNSDKALAETSTKARKAQYAVQKQHDTATP